MMGNAQLAQSFENSIGSGLLTDTLCFMFTNSDIDIRKEMPDKGLCGSHHLIAHYRQLAPSGLEFIMIDPEIVVEQIVVNPDNNHYSYFGNSKY